MKFVVTADDVTKDLHGGAYMKVFSNLDDAGRRDQAIYGQTEGVVMSKDGYTAVGFNPNSKQFAGFIYAKGAFAGEGGIKAEGQAGRVNGIRVYSFDGKTLNKVGQTTMTGYGNSGYFGNYFYATQGANPQVITIDAAGNAKQVDIDFSKYQINGSNPSLTGITDLGNNQVAIAINYADRDSFAVAFADYSLKVNKVIYSKKAGSSLAGRKATRFNHLVKDAQGNLYAFGGTAKSADKVGAVRINKGTTEFDDSYYFDINKATNGYKIRKVFHMTDDKFLLELFPEAGKSDNMSGTGKFVIADMSDKKITPVTGISTDYTGAYIGWGDSYNGKFYLPISNGTGLVPNKATGITPTIYAIDATGKATVFMTLKSNEIIKGFTILTR